MYTFRCLADNDALLFAVENSHGKSHMHLKEQKIETNYDWRQAFKKFDELKSEYEKRKRVRR